MTVQEAVQARQAQTLLGVRVLVLVLPVQARVRQVLDLLAMRALEAVDLEMGPVLPATVLALLEMKALVPDPQVLIHLGLVQEPLHLEMAQAPQTTALDPRAPVLLVMDLTPPATEMLEAVLQEAAREMEGAYLGMVHRPQATIFQAILQLHHRLPIARSRSIHPNVNTGM